MIFVVRLRGTLLTRTGAITDPGSAAQVFASTDPDDANYLHLKLGSVALDGGNDDYIDGNADDFVVADTVGLETLPATSVSTANM